MSIKPAQYLMNKPFKPGEELISLNEELHTEFSIQELEQRLETTR